MRFSTATAAMLLAGAAIAAPTERAEGNSIKQVKNPKYRGKNGAIAYEKVLKKYGAPIPSEVASAAAAARAGHYGFASHAEMAAAATTTGSAVATPEDNDVEYLVPVQIGTPAQTLYLDFDTGSADLWVFSSETPASEVNGQTVYKIASSSTAKKLTGATWDITYGDGSSCSGDVYTDKVTVGGVTVTSQAVESAETVSSAFQDGTLDGLLGLAFSTINTVSPTAQKTFFANAGSSLAANVLTADLRHDEPGTYNFGYIDKSLYSGTISYSKVTTTRGFWEFTGTGYQIGSGTYTTASIDAIADTGTTLLYLPRAIANAYWAQVSSATYSSVFGGFVFDCDATLPDFTFGIGTYRGVVPGEYINYATALGSKCYGGIQRDTGIGISIFGDIVLKSQFVVFDAANTQLGWAAKA